MLLRICVLKCACVCVCVVCNKNKHEHTNASVCSHERTDRTGTLTPISIRNSLVLVVRFEQWGATVRSVMYQCSHTFMSMQLEFSSTHTHTHIQNNRISPCELPTTPTDVDRRMHMQCACVNWFMGQIIDVVITLCRCVHIGGMAQCQWGTLAPECRIIRVFLLFLFLVRLWSTEKQTNSSSRNDRKKQ